MTEIELYEHELDKDELEYIHYIILHRKCELENELFKLREALFVGGCIDQTVEIELTALIGMCNKMLLKIEKMIKDYDLIVYRTENQTKYQYYDDYNKILSDVDVPF